MCHTAKNKPSASKLGATQMTDECVMRMRLARCQRHSCSSHLTNGRRRTVSLLAPRLLLCHSSTMSNWGLMNVWEPVRRVAHRKSEWRDCKMIWRGARGRGSRFGAHSCSYDQTHKEQEWKSSTLFFTNSWWVSSWATPFLFLCGCSTRNKE